MRYTVRDVAGHFIGDYDAEHTAIKRADSCGAGAYVFDRDAEVVCYVS